MHWDTSAHSARSGVPPAPHHPSHDLITIATLSMYRLTRRPLRRYCWSRHHEGNETNVSLDWVTPPPAITVVPASIHRSCSPTVASKIHVGELRDWVRSAPAGEVAGSCGKASAREVAAVVQVGARQYHGVDIDGVQRQRSPVASPQFFGAPRFMNAPSGGDQRSLGSPVPPAGSPAAQGQPALSAVRPTRHG